MPPESIRAGKTIADKYRIESLLGSGAMGTVWIATHVNLGSKVAVKLVSPEFARSAEARTRFLAEAKAAASLRSRYVVQMFDSGVTDEGAPYIVMEYLRGESLEDRIQRVGRIPLSQVVRIIGQVAKGLDRAHSSNIVHRDLKPANIFIAATEDGEEVAKILDFGIAKMEHEDKDYKATATGVIMGTPLFMSPEQARGLKSVDATSDVYSLGMMTYAATVGDVPFHAESFGDLVYMVCTQDLPPTQAVAPWLPPTMGDWFRRACHKDQTQRFPSAKEAYEALVIAASLSQPGPELAAISDTNSTLNDPSLFESGGSRITGKIRSSAAAASTVPFSSSDEVSASWNGAGQSSGGQQEASGGAGPNSGALPSREPSDADSVNSLPSTPIPKRGNKGAIVVGLLVAAAAAGGLVWASSSSEPPEAPALGATAVDQSPPQPSASSEPSAKPQPTVAAAEDTSNDTDTEKSQEGAAEGKPSATTSKAATAGSTEAGKPSTTKPKARTVSTPKARTVSTPKTSTKTPKPTPRPKASVATQEPTPKPKPAPQPIDLGF